MAKITQPVLWDKDFNKLVREAIERIRESNPAYTALFPSDPGVTIIEACAYILTLFGYALNRLPQATLASLVNYLGVETKGATPAVGAVRVEFDGPLPEELIIPKGERFVGVRGITYRATQEVLAPEGSTEIDVPVECETLGTLGNLPANSIFETYRRLPYVMRVYNPQPLTGGTDEESEAEALERGRLVLTHLWRAVTAKDWEQIAVSVPGIKRAKVIETPGMVRLYVLTASHEKMSTELRARVTSAIEAHRMQGIPWALYDAVLKSVNVSARIRLVAGYSLSGVRQIAEKELGKLLNPDTWEWGRKVAVSEILATLEGLEGIDYVEELILPRENIVLEDYELATLGTVTLHEI